MTDNEKTTGVPIDDDALDKVAGGMGLAPKDFDNSYQPGIPNYGTQSIRDSNEPSCTKEIKNNMPDIPVNQIPPDITDARPMTWDERLREQVESATKILESMYK